MLPRTHRMELLSKAYVRAVVAQAGWACDELESDYGIDIAVRDIGSEGSGFFDQGPLVELQLKSTTTVNARVTDEAIHYDLLVRNYEHLRNAIPGNPRRFLVLFLMPADEATWLSQDRDGLTLRQCCYFMSIQGSPETSNQHTINVSIPRSNVFSVSFLQQLVVERRAS